MRGIAIALLLAVSFGPCTSLLAGAIPPLEERAQWFRHDRFGMFVHWGVYAIVGKGEWVRHTGKIPEEEYQKLPPQFNPTQFNAADWIAQAKQAGQKYFVVTTKHHDGFCMFDSALTDYDIMSTPFRRDIIKELADECHRQGVHLGFYYSIMDWHHPDYLPRRPWEKNRSVEGADFARYVEFMRGQIRELMTKYGRVDILWFDGGWERKKPEDLAAFQGIIDMARQLQPHMLVNNRAGIAGDFDTPEQRIPATGVVDEAGRPMLWEACMTMTTGHGSFAPTAWWGYDRDETEFKPAQELVHKLVDVVSKGGNFLLNVGPAPKGTIRPEEAKRLATVGRWMSRYGEAIYGTDPCPFRLLPFFGRVTRKKEQLFVHVFDWPSDCQLMLPGLKTPIAEACLMDDPSVKVGSRREGANLLLDLPPTMPDKLATVIRLKLAGPLEVEPIRIAPDAKGLLALPAHYAEIHAKHGQRARPMSKGGRTYIGNWSNPNDQVVWTFELRNPGKFRVEVDATPASQAAVGQKVQVECGGKKLVGKIDAKGVSLSGPLLVAAGQNTLTVRLLDAKRTGPPILDLFGVRLVPAP